MKKHKVVSFILALCMVLTMTPAVAFADISANDAETQSSQAFADMTGHWAAAAVSQWAGLGIVKGDDRGFRPNDSITRAELAVILDNLMDYQTKANNTFTDVKSGAWYADAVLKANAAGILNGDGAGHALPSAKVTREQAAVMLARAFGVDENTGDQTSFKDASNISKWAKTLVFGMEFDQYVGGMGNGNFEPKTNITRAQVVTMIDNAVKAYYTEAGTYTENVSPTAANANCVAIVRTSGVTLKRLKLSGDLIVAEGVGTGDFTLDGATVTGKLIARGGGENSIHVINGADVKGKVSIEKIDGVVRIVSDGIVIANLDAEDSVILEGEFTNVVVKEGASVEVRGQVKNLDIQAKAEIKLTKDAKVGTLSVAKEAEGTNLDIDKAAELKTLKTEAKMTTSGDGAPGTVTGTGTVTDKETGKTENTAATSGGGGGSGGNGGNDNNTATDKRSISFKYDDYTTAVSGKSAVGEYIWLEGTDSSGSTCDALDMGEAAVKNKDDGSLLDSSEYTCIAEEDYIKLLPTYIKNLTEGKHIIEFSVTASDGKVFTLDYTIYIIPAAATILYDQPQYGTLEVNEYTGEIVGDFIASGGSIDITGNKYLVIKLIDLPSDKRIKSVNITDSYYGFSETEDYTQYFVSRGAEITYNPKGTVTIQVITEDVPASLPEITGVELYLNYDHDTDTYSNKVTDTIPSMKPLDETALYAKVLFADGQASEFANYLWQFETESGDYEDLFPSTKHDCMWLYTAGSASGHRIKLTVSGYEKQSQGTGSTIIYIEKALLGQAQPTDLTASAISSSTATDGKIGNTTTDMEYKLVRSYDGNTEDYSDSGYITCTAEETITLAGGTYSVRYKAKTGYSAGSEATIIIAMNQAAPTGLVGVTPTSLSNTDAKISSTTTDMECKRSGENFYWTCSAGETLVTIPTTYYVRYKAKDGYYAGADAVVTVDSFTNQD